MKVSSKRLNENDSFLTCKDLCDKHTDINYYRKLCWLCDYLCAKEKNKPFSAFAFEIQPYGRLFFISGGDTLYPRFWSDWMHFQQYGDLSSPTNILKHSLQIVQSGGVGSLRACWTARTVSDS